jgi:hypothetical protein
MAKLKIDVFDECNELLLKECISKKLILVNGVRGLRIL